MERLLLVCLGGAIGSGARYLVSLWSFAWLGPALPYGTFIVNVTGSFVLAVLIHIVDTTDWISPTLRTTLAAGVLGGFTTYSSFSYETFRFLQDGATTTAVLYVASTVIGCLAACALGTFAARFVAGA